MKTLGNKFRTQKGTINKLYSNAFENCKIEGNKIYAKTYKGSGRFITLQDNSNYIEQMIQSLGYKFSEGNDAPRGGKAGDFIKVSKRAIEVLKSQF